MKPSGNADFDQMIETYYEILPGNETRGASAVGQQIEQDLNNAVSVALTGEKTPDRRWPTPRLVAAGLGPVRRPGKR